MMLFLFGLVVSVVLTVVFIAWACQDDEWYNLISCILGITSGTVATIFLVIFCCFIWNWQASEYQAKIINREYDTDYTREEVFYASNVIDTIQKLERTRTELIINTKGKEE